MKQSPFVATNTNLQGNANGKAPQPRQAEEAYMSLAYFNEDVGGTEQLWVTDGTPAGTHLVQSFSTGAIFDLTTIGSRVYFTIDDGVDGRELWTSDGTTAGTVLVKDINPGSGASYPSSLTNVNGTLYFQASDPTHGSE